jgi:hypothetical protein
MLRHLLNVASIVCLVLCVALMGMWVRSYYWTDEVYFTPPGATTVGGGSIVGRITMGALTRKGTGLEERFYFRHVPIADWRSEGGRLDKEFSSVAGFGFLRETGACVIAVPYWFAVIFVGAFSFAPWSRVKYRFSLRSLFIATTFLAVVLGIIAWLDRAWIGR